MKPLLRFHTHALEVLGPAAGLGGHGLGEM